MRTLLFIKRAILLLGFSISAYNLPAQGDYPFYDKTCDCYGYAAGNDSVYIKARYAYANKFSEGLASVKLDKKYGFIDKKDKTVVPFIYSDAGSFSEGLAAVKIDDKWGFINKKGILVIAATIEADRLDDFKDGMAAVRLKGKWGFLDKKGNLAIPHMYDRAYQFSEGLAAVEPIAQKGYGYINKKGEMAIPPQFKYAYNFGDNGVALVSTATRSSIHIDKTGRILEDQENEISAAPAKPATVIPVSKANSKAFASGKANYSEDDLKNLKIAKDAGNWEYVGFMYINHGDFEEGEAIIKNEIAKGKCEYCAFKLESAQYDRKFPKAALDASKAAADNLSNQSVVNAAVASLKKMVVSDGLPMAAYYLAKGYESGQIHYPNKEIDSALYYYLKAAKQGYQPAMSALGRLYKYASGSDVPMPRDKNKYAYLIDNKEARYWYNESAKKGNKFSEKEVAYLDQLIETAELSDAYNKGYDAFEAKNYTEAYRLWHLSATKANNGKAYFGLAILHQLGYAPNASLTTAMEYYQKASDLGVQDALAEKQKIQEYFNAVAAAKQKAAASSTTTTTSNYYKSESYDEWWQKTYGKGGSQNRTAMPNNNIPQASYKTPKQSEADRHRQAMDAIQRSIERDQNRRF